MKKTLTATLLMAMATPTFAGGPVVIEEEPEVVAERPASSASGVIVPLMLLVAVGLIVTSNRDEVPAESCVPSSAEC